MAILPISKIVISIVVIKKRFCPAKQFPLFLNGFRFARICGIFPENVRVF